MEHRPDPAEQAFEVPFVAQGAALPAGDFTPFARGPFRLLVAAHGLSGLAFWGYFGTVFAQAAFRYHADASRMAVLGASLSIPFIFGMRKSEMIRSKSRCASSCNASGAE